MEIKDRKQLRVLLLAYYYDKSYDDLLSKSNFYDNIPTNERNNAEVFLIDEHLVIGGMSYVNTGILPTITRINSKGTKIIEDIAEARYNLENPISNRPNPPSKTEYLRLFYNQCIKPNSASICDAAMKAAFNAIPNL